MKKLISLALTAVMLFALLPLSVFAETDPLIYTFSDDGTYCIVSRCDTSATKVVIPAEFDGLPVKEIGNDAFSNCKSLTSIEIQNGVTSIGDRAFFYCSTLTSVEIPNSVTSIGDHAFEDCWALESVEIPNGVTTIGNYAFAWCTSMTSVVIPNSITAIKGYVFYDCSALTSVEIPNSVVTIGDFAFARCSALVSVEIPNSVTSIGVGSFYDCTSLANIEIPNSVISIGDNAFEDCWALESIEIPSGVTTIGSYAFAWCKSLASIKIPSSVVSIGTDWIKSSANLTDIYCEAEEQPESWDSKWRDSCSAIAHWGYKNGIVESVDKNAIPAGANTVVKKIGNDTVEIPEELKVEIAAVYDITLSQNAEDIQPNGKVKVLLTALENINIETAKVYHFADDGTLTDMNAVYENGFFVFETEHFGIYVAANEVVDEPEETPEENPEDTTPESILGDVNNDGKVDADDYILLKRVYFGQANLSDLTRGDINKDGKVNADDYILLKRVYFGQAKLK